MYANVILVQDTALILVGEGSGNNYAYLVTDDKSKDAVIIDPANPPEYDRQNKSSSHLVLILFRVLPALKKATESGVKITNIINTHQ